MPSALTAFLLSALVFPGLGQLYKQDRQKGVILILLANLFLGLLLLAGLITFSQEYLAHFFPAPLSLEILRPLLLKVIARPLFLIPCGLMAGLWTFAAWDALRRSPPSQEG
jgi:Na+-driven multidrug efflux pump